MRYFHCPKTYRSKPYGCGRGPWNATEAILDRYGKCWCGKDLKPYKAPKLPVAAARCQVRALPDLGGHLYCNSPVREGRYCSRHAYLNHSSPVEESKAEHDRQEEIRIALAEESQRHRFED